MTDLARLYHSFRPNVLVSVVHVQRSPPVLDWLTRNILHVAEVRNHLCFRFAAHRVHVFDSGSLISAHRPNTTG
jgi:hypothetical protein